MEYTVQRGDTIAQVTKRMGISWQQLKDNNPQAVGRSNLNGNWFVREGATLSDQGGIDFAETLKELESIEAAKTATATTATEATDAGGERSHTLKAGDTVWELATKTYGVDPQEILKLNNITDPRSLQIGQTLRIPSNAAVAEEQSGEVVASWYGAYHQGRLMANGEPFDMYAATIAHKDIPLGTKVLLKNPETGEQATATVTDRGPYINGRDVDLSYGLAQRLSLAEQGVGSLILEVL